MRTSSISGESIWEALSAEAEFVAQIPEQAHGVWQEYAAAVVPVLEPLAEKPLTAESFVEAKLEVIRLTCEGEWMQKVLGAYPEEAFPLGMKAMFEMVVGMLESMIPQLAEMATDVPAFLDAHGLTEEVFLAHESAGRFTPATMELWRSGMLTVGILMNTQPSAIFRND